MLIKIKESEKKYGYCKDCLFWDKFGNGNGKCAQWSRQISKLTGGDILTLITIDVDSCRKFKSM